MIARIGPLDPAGMLPPSAEHRAKLRGPRHRAGARTSGSSLVSFNALLAGLQHTIEDVNHTALERVFCAHDEQTIMFDQPLENLGVMAQLIR